MVSQPFCSSPLKGWNILKIDLDGLTRFCQQHSISCRTNTPMREYTTFRVGGDAAFSALPSSAEELTLLVRELRRIKAEPVWFIGRGSNLLVSDNGLDGVVVFTWGLSELKREEQTVIADAGVGMNALCRVAQSEGLTGLEFAYGIPGTVGGGVFMNAGAYGGEMRDVLEWVEYLDETGEVKRLPKEKLELSYRRSIFSAHPDWCILRAAFGLEKGNKQQIGDKMSELMTRRREKQPLEYPSAGSTFKRPEGAFAGSLVEQCGLKGTRVGDAQVSEKHAGFIINLGGATCADICQLIQKVQQTVQQKTGYWLEPEVRRLGD